MRIGLLGGVFESPMGSYAHSAPENVLLRFLRELGHHVVPMSIDRQPSLGVALDVYHANHFGVAGYALMLAGVRPLVFTSHNPFLVSDVAVPESRIDRMLQPLQLRTADVVVALSRREAELLRARFSLDDAVRIEVIPNGLDLTLYGPAEPDGAALDVLTVAQLVPYKGHEYLLRAFARVAARFPASRLVLVTSRHDGRPELERLAAELEIADRLVFEGPYDTRRLAERYRRCAVYVQPSLAECFPVTILEAMASGAPVIATDVGGVREELGDAGVVVPPCDEDALAAALERLLENEPERRRLGEAAAARCRDLYDGRRVAQRHAELYEELAAERTPTRGRAERRAAARLAVAGMLGRRRVMPLLARRRGDG